MYSDVMGGGARVLSGTYREHRTRISVSCDCCCAMHYVLGRGIWFFVYCREQNSLPSDLNFSMYSDVTGRGGGVGMVL